SQGYVRSKGFGAMKFMHIGDVAKKVGVSQRCLRYYEELGIIEPEHRTSGGYRLYSEDQVNKLRMIDGLKSLGLPLSQIRDILTVKNGAGIGAEKASRVLQLFNLQLQQIDDKIVYYHRLRASVVSAVEIVMMNCSCCHKDMHMERCQDCEVITGRKDLPLPMSLLT
ncbi:MAG: MerR family transcriptional regulator, partial [Bacteroidota bacterium]